MVEQRYRIVSAPKSIEFECPFCHEIVNVDVKDTSIDIWEGGIQECPNCHEDVNLHEWEYD